MKIININNIFNITKNFYDINLVIYEITFRWEWIIIPGLNKQNKKFARELFNQIINAKYISKNDTIKIKFFY